MIGECLKIGVGVVVILDILVDVIVVGVFVKVVCLNGRKVEKGYD